MTEASEERPKIRPLEAFPAEHEGQKVIALKDPLGVSPEIVFLPLEAYFLVSLMDGTNTLRDLQAAYMRRYGTLLYMEKIEDLINQLDKYYLLDNQNFQQLLHNLKVRFKEAKVREAAFAGTGYASDPDQLASTLRGYFTAAGGPGLPHPEKRDKLVKGIIAPHIDFGRGGICYAHAYKSLAESQKADLYVIIGTCHTPMENPFCFTRKPFSTPFGTVEVAGEIVSSCAEVLPFDPFYDEFSHRNEHSIELQLIFLQHTQRGEAFRIFPILCGSFQAYIANRISPMEDPRYSVAIEHLSLTLAQREGVCLVASADLAHIGPQFGDHQPVTAGILADVRARDLEMLGYAQRLDPEGFYRYILSERDRRNICGLPPIYTFLKIIVAQEGVLLNYHQWQDPGGRGAVTFAGLAFW